jgi:AraC-like DNA-binding protein
LLLAFGGIRQISLADVIFTNKEENSSEKSIRVDEIVLQKVLNQMEVNKDFLNPSLTLKEFAKTLKLPARMVSEHINNGLNKSFVDFVNEYRVNEVKRKLQSGELEVYTILAVAFDSGFNSKATFNRTFKKITGQSPREFIS